MTDEWILLDTETTGIRSPIYILEVFALRIKGWTPVDEGYHCFLNHNVFIPPEATAVHGYTKEFLARHGINPYQAHEGLQNYIQNRHVSSHNLPYDWGRCLLPETERLGIPIPGVPGFCTVQLLRRALPGHKSYKIEALQELFSISRKAHNAKGDVLSIAQILAQNAGPRLRKAQILTLAEVIQFSKKTPIKKCADFLDGKDQNPRPRKKATRSQKEAADSLLVILSDITADQELTEEEILRLDNWLSKNGDEKTNLLQEQIKDALKDGLISPEENLAIFDSIQAILDSPERTPKPPENESKKLPTPRQLNYIKILGGKLPLDADREEASKFIDQLKAANNQVTQRQKMVLRFWGKISDEENTRSQITHWLDRFYKEDPDRLAAWELYKEENPKANYSENLETIDPVGESYLRRIKTKSQEEPSFWEKLKRKFFT